MVEDEELRARWEEYHKELENIKNKRKNELEQLRSHHPEILSQDDESISYDSASLTLDSSIGELDNQENLEAEQGDTKKIQDISNASVDSFKSVTEQSNYKLQNNDTFLCFYVDQ